MNEAETRAEHIDPALKAAGWGVVEGSRVLREHGITLGRLQPSANGGSGTGGTRGLNSRAYARFARSYQAFSGALTLKMTDLQLGNTI
jgi:hypothetical protein